MTRVEITDSGWLPIPPPLSPADRVRLLELLARPVNRDDPGSGGVGDHPAWPEILRRFGAGYLEPFLRTPDPLPIGVPLSERVRAEVLAGVRRYTSDDRPQTLRVATGYGVPTWLKAAADSYPGYGQ